VDAAAAVALDAVAAAVTAADSDAVAAAVSDVAAATAAAVVVEAEASAGEDVVRNAMRQGTTAEPPVGVNSLVPSVCRWNQY
jgi:hypothetical protein